MQHLTDWGAGMEEAAQPYAPFIFVYTVMKFFIGMWNVIPKWCQVILNNILNVFQRFRNKSAIFCNSSTGTVIVRLDV